MIDFGMDIVFLLEFDGVFFRSLFLFERELFWELIAEGVFWRFEIVIELIGGVDIFLDWRRYILSWGFKDFIDLGKFVWIVLM